MGTYTCMDTLVLSVYHWYIYLDTLVLSVYHWKWKSAAMPCNSCGYTKKSMVHILGYFGIVSLPLEVEECGQAMPCNSVYFGNIDVPKNVDFGSGRVRPYGILEND